MGSGSEAGRSGVTMLCAWECDPLDAGFSFRQMAAKGTMGPAHLVMGRGWLRRPGMRARSRASGRMRDPSAGLSFRTL